MMTAPNTTTIAAPASRNAAGKALPSADQQGFSPSGQGGEFADMLAKLSAPDGEPKQAPQRVSGCDAAGSTPGRESLEDRVLLTEATPIDAQGLLQQEPAHRDEDDDVTAQRDVAARVAVALGTVLAPSGNMTTSSQHAMARPDSEEIAPRRNPVQGTGSDGRQRLENALAAVDANAAASQATNGAVAVVKQETHFVPVSTPLQQASRRIETEGREEQGGARVENEGGATEAPADSPAEDRLSRMTLVPRQQRWTSLPVENKDTATKPQQLVSLASDASTDVEALDSRVPSGMPTSPAHQIAKLIASDTPLPAPSTARAGSPAAADKMLLPSPVKVLSIQLQPVELGSITVRMALRNAALDVQIVADRQETTRLLQQDRDTLSKLLQSNGVQTDSIVVLGRIPDAVVSSGGSQAFSQFSPQYQSHSGSPQPDARPSGKQGQGGQEDTNGGASRDGSDEPRNSAGAGSSLYV